MQGQKNARVILGDVEDVDVGGKTVALADGEQIGYDTLVLAPGAHHSYFGRDEWANDAPALKPVEDAIEIRRRILIASRLPSASPIRKSGATLVASTQSASIPASC